MKMEYERYSERYRRNETNGNVGIISEDSEVIRRRTMLQEQQREELRRKKLKKRKEELRRRRRRKQRAKELFCLCICVAMLVLIVALVRRGISSKKQDVSEVVAANRRPQSSRQMPRNQRCRQPERLRRYRVRHCRIIMRRNIWWVHRHTIRWRRFRQD